MSLDLLGAPLHAGADRGRRRVEDGDAVALDQDDPLSKAIHGLLDHAAETDRRLASLLKELEAAGFKCDEEVLAADRFDPNYLSKIVD